MTRDDPRASLDSVADRLSRLRLATDTVTPKADFVERVLVAVHSEAQSTWAALVWMGRRALLPLTAVVVITSIWAFDAEHATVSVFWATASPMDWGGSW